MAVTVIAESADLSKNLPIENHVAGRGEDILDTEQGKPFATIGHGLGIPAIRPRYLVMAHRISQAFPTAITVDDNQIAEYQIDTTAQDRPDDRIETPSSKKVIRIKYADPLLPRSLDKLVQSLRRASVH
jgi:hypothetical protein